MKKKLMIPLITLSGALCSAMLAAPGSSIMLPETVEASTAGKTREQALEWAEKQVNKGIDHDGYSGVQCTDLIQMYAQALGQHLPAVGASKYITCPLPAGWKRYDNKTTPQAGDIFIYNSNQYGAYSAGHVGIILKVDSSGYECIEYNWSGQLFGAKRRVSGQRSFSYIIRPDFPTSKISSAKNVSVDTGYYILNSASGNKFLDVAGNSSANDANIWMWSPTGKGGQTFYIGRNSANTGYTMRNLTSGKYVNTDTNTPGRHNVTQYQGNNLDGQQWIFQDAGGGYVLIRNFFNYYLDVANAANNDGTNVGVYEFFGSNAQKWKLAKVSGKEKTRIAPGEYIIRSKIGGKVLDVAGASLESGANLHIYTQNYSTAQKFTVGWNDSIGCNYIYNTASGKYVDTSAVNTTGNALQSDKTLNKTQTWFFEDAGDGYYYIRNLWGYYLDVAHGVNSDGTNVNVWSFTDGDKQKWKLEKADKRTGVYLINNKWTYLKNGIIDTSFTGVAKSSTGNSVFVRKGYFDESYTGIAKSSVSGEYVFVRKGKYDSSFTGVAADTTGTYRFVRSGRFDGKFTGVAKSINGNYVFVRNGIYDTSFTGVALSINGNYVYVKNGRYVESFTGIAKSINGNYLYVQKGHFNEKHTGVVYSSDLEGWVFVRNGRYTTSFTGVAQSTTGNYVFVRNGKFDESFTGVAKSINNNFVYVKNGKYNTSYTGLAPATDGRLYYVKSGRWVSSYNGNVTYKGKSYNVKNGIAV